MQSPTGTRRAAFRSFVVGAALAVAVATLAGCSRSTPDAAVGGGAADARPTLQGVEVVQGAVTEVGGSTERPSTEAFAVSADDRRPVLVWAWSPTCSTCNITAPSVERFARDNAGSVRVVGLGTQGDEGAARAFARRHGLGSVQMLWDPSFATWEYLGFAGQPAGRLFTPDGELVGEWYGPIPEDDVLADVRALAAASATTAPVPTTGGG